MVWSEKMNLRSSKLDQLTILEFIDKVFTFLINLQKCSNWTTPYYWTTPNRTTPIWSISASMHLFEYLSLHFIHIFEQVREAPPN